MNKSELIKAIAQKSKTTEIQARTIVNALIEVIQDCIASDQPVVMTGFGTFKTKHRKGYTGRNPRTGKPLEIAPCISPIFKPGSVFKNKVAKNKVNNN